MSTEPRDNSISGEKLMSFFDDEQNHHRMRQKLIRFFNCELHSTAQDHEECADETIARVIQKINEGIEITGEAETDGIEKYTFGIAKFVKREYWRRQKFESLEDFESDARTDERPEIRMFERWEQAEIRSCYRKFLTELNDDERVFLNDYYNPPPGVKPKDARKKIETALGISNSSLRKRALRLREKLEEYMKKYLPAGGTKLKKPHT